MTTDRDIARWRLRTQRLVPPYAASSASVVDGLLAVQAENPGQAAWAVACRTDRPDAAQLDALLADGEVVRTHVLRPTWHFVGAADIGWLLSLTAPRIRPVMLRQLAQLPGVATADVDRRAAAVLDILAQDPDRTRDELAEALRVRGLESPGVLVTALLILLELDQLVCSGRPSQGVHTYALFADRVTERVPGGRARDREEALAELALRYFTGHGPATERDLAYWATLTLADVRRGLDAVRDRLDSFHHDGRTFWHAPGQSPPEPSSAPEGHLLQLLDEIYRGYQDSRMVLDSERIVPRGRESTIGIALVDAQLVAGMKRTVGRRAVFELTPYDGPLRPEQLRALEVTAARYAEFLGLEHELVVR